VRFALSTSAKRTQNAGVSEIDKALSAARERLGRRATSADLDDVRARGGLVIDTRPSAQREADGELPEAIVVDRNVLEWRLDPTSPNRLPQVTGPDQPMVIVCNEGYASTLAAVSLRDLGLTDVTDLAGGFQAWRAELRG
jgi:rhodanese-related sulfurtransferase